MIARLFALAHGLKARQLGIPDMAVGIAMTAIGMAILQRYSAQQARLVDELDEARAVAADQLEAVKEKIENGHEMLAHLQARRQAAMAEYNEAYPQPEDLDPLGAGDPS